MKHSRTSVMAPVATAFALSLALVAGALCAPAKPGHPLRNGKEIAELCVKMNKATTLNQSRAFVTGGCMVINPGNRLGRDKCVKQAMARIKQLRPNIR